MRPACSFAVVLATVGWVAGCSEEPAPLAFVEVAPEIMRPVEISAHTRYEVWALGEPTAAGQRVAQTRDGGGSWREFALPQLARNAPVQLGADGKGRVWIVGTAPGGEPALISIDALTLEPTIRHHEVFPPGTREVVLHTGGYDPDPMITARVPDTEGLALFVFDEFLTRTWYRHPMAEITSLVGIYSSDGGYFLRGTGEAATLEFCSLPGGETYCFAIPPFVDNAGIFTSNPTPSIDFLWHADGDGGTVVQRRGVDYETHHVAGWPAGLEPVRFFALSTGDRGILGHRDGVVSWLPLEADGSVEREVVLGDCDCNPHPDRVRLLRDGSIIIPAGTGWWVASIVGL